jgi:hypothetical protein
MATYQELFTLSQDTQLLQRVAAACAVHGQTVLAEQPAVLPRFNWARNALVNPLSVAEGIIWYLLSANAAFTPAQIQAATDEAILTAVVNAVDATAVFA